MPLFLAFLWGGGLYLAYHRPLVGLRRDGEGPLPVVVWGHGLNGDRDSIGIAQNNLTDNAVAILGSDALQQDQPVYQSIC